VISHFINGGEEDGSHDRGNYEPMKLDSSTIQEKGPKSQELNWMKELKSKPEIIYHFFRSKDVDYRSIDLSMELLSLRLKMGTMEKRFRSSS
jgi:hypothetical protein